MKMMMIVLVSLGFVAASLAQEGVVQVAGKSILLNHDDRLSWDDANAYCQKRGMQLISLPNKEKDDAINAFLLSNIDYHVHFWTSGKRSGSSFYWTAINRAFSYTNWESRNVNPRPGHDCVSMVENHKGEETYNWHAERCNGLNALICEQ